MLSFSSVSVAQKAPISDFGETAARYDSLVVVDYNAKNIVAVKQHLNEVLKEYNKLSPMLRDKYKEQLSGIYYNAACTYALAGQKKEAMECLMRSDYSDYDHVLEDTDLDTLRNDPMFRAFLNKTKNTRSRYMRILASGGMLDDKIDSLVPPMTYEPAEDPDLVNLRKAFALDSVAGKANERSQIINIMHWVHNTIAHNGSKDNPGDRNALNLLNTCIKKGKTCNCRGLAITLSELYLAMGYRARYATCLPMDSTDNDCHVITEVYSNTLRKWVWMDPIFDAYVMDEEGTLLSIAEVRARLIMNRPLILTPEANWNHKNSQSKRSYLYNYMAKNLYRIEYPLNSTFNFDSPGKGKKRTYVQVKPASYKRGKAMDKNADGNYIVYYTSHIGGVLK